MRAIVSSLAAFVAAGLWPRTTLARAIVLVLVLKLIGIVSIKILMFPGSGEPVIDASTMASALGLSSPRDNR